MQLQGALSPGGVFVNALAAGGIVIQNVTVAPNVTGGEQNTLASNSRTEEMSGRILEGAK